MAAVAPCATVLEQSTGGRDGAVAAVSADGSAGGEPRRKKRRRMDLKPSPVVCHYYDCESMISYCKRTTMMIIIKRQCCLYDVVQYQRFCYYWTVKVNVVLSVVSLCVDDVWP